MPPQFWDALFSQIPFAIAIAIGILVAWSREWFVSEARHKRELEAERERTRAAEVEAAKYKGKYEDLLLSNIEEYKEKDRTLEMIARAAKGDA